MSNRYSSNRQTPRQRTPTFDYQSLEARRVLAAPVAVNDVLAVVQNSMSSVEIVLANDTDADGDALAIVSTSDPDNGTLATVNGQLQYAPTNGFSGDDSFVYVIEDPEGNQSAATVHLSVNAAVDINAARSQILNGVDGAIANPTQPGKIITYGPTSFSVVHDAGQNETQSLLAGSSLGEGRVLAFNDHQWLNFQSYGDDANQAAIYLNGIDWLGQQASGTPASKAIKVVTLNSTGNAAWLTAQGYTDVVNATWSTLQGSLVDAEVLIVGWIGNNTSAANIQLVSDFAKDGGGVFVSDYASGYDWWWNKPIHEAPGNILLRDAGILLMPEIVWTSGPVANDATVTNLSGQVVLGVIDKSFAVGEATELLAFSKFAKLLDYLPADDPLRHQLDSAFLEHRFGDVQATPENPQTSSLAKARLTAEASWLARQPVDALPAHPTAEDVYGAIPADAVRVDGLSVTVNLNNSGWHAIGLYAAPGDLVTLTVPAELVGQGYRFRINGHVDNVSGRSSWDRLPFGISRSFEINATTVQIANSFGGTIYLDVNGSAATAIPPNLGDVRIVVDGAIEAPTFRLGEMTDAQWEPERQKPGAYAELTSGRLAMSVPSAWIRELDTVNDLMTYWDQVVERMDWVGAVESLRTGPERFNVDVQISVGLLHAGYPIQGPTWASTGLVDLEQLEQSGNWGYFHELGHEKQRHNVLGHGYNSAWTFDGDTEVTVNIFANAGLELQVPNSPTGGWGYSVHPELVMQRAEATINNLDADNFESKDPYPFYFQLADGEWGWQGYRDVLATYVDDYLNAPSELPGDNSAEKDQWLIRWSEVSGYDMTEYMVDHWKLEVSQEARNAVAAMSLPNWLPLAVKKDVLQSQTVAESAVSFDLGTAGLTRNDSATLVSAGNSINGTLVDDGNGIFTWSPNDGFVGRGTFEVTYRSTVGNEQIFLIEVDVVDRGVLVETFEGIAGSSLDSLTSSASYPDAPDRVEVLTDFETPTNQADDYGVRARAWLEVPATGEYTFWIASDDEGRLLLSSDTNPENASVIATVSEWTSPRQWDKFASQESVTVSLVQDESYYIEALMKEGGGSDNLAIAWASPQLGITEPTVIANEYLGIFGLDLQAPVVTNQSGLVVEGDSMRLTTGQLAVRDPDSASFAHVYVLSELPTEGELWIDGAVAQVGSSFTGKDIVDEKIEYRHSGNNATDDFFLFAVTDSGGNVSESSNFQIDITAVYDNISSVEIGDGTSQRSRIESVRVNFGELVDFENGDALAAFTFSRLSDGQHVSLLLNSIDDSSGVTVVTLKFTGAMTRAGGALVDGNYQLDVTGSNINVRGTTTRGVDFSFGDNQLGDDGLFSLYGDNNGDRTVNVFDLLAFRRTYRAVDGDANYVLSLDFNDDGIVNVFDLLKFRQRYGNSI